MSTPFSSLKLLMQSCIKFWLKAFDSFIPNIRVQKTATKGNANNPFVRGLVDFLSSWNQVANRACYTDLDTSSDWCAITKFRRAFCTCVYFIPCNLLCKAKRWIVAPPVPTAFSGQVVRGRLARAHCRIGTGISNLSPEYVCGATLTHTPVPLRAFPTVCNAQTVGRYAVPMCASRELTSVVTG